MLRVIFDTNIFGDLVEERDSKELQEAIRQDKDFVVYGFSVIRKEIRNIPKTTKTSKKARSLILSIYDNVTKGKTIEHSDEIEKLAKDYFKWYKKFGGNNGWSKMKEDLLIVACATLNKLDIIYTSDKRSMVSKAAKRAYRQLVVERRMKLPSLLSYEILLANLRKGQKSN